MSQSNVYPFEILFLQQRTLGLKLTPNENLKILYELASAIHKIMERHGVVYFLDSGSAIGAFRHKGIIPWDDDLDIVVLDKSEHVLQGPVKEDLHNEYGINVVRLIDGIAGYKIFVAWPNEHVFCDVWIISQREPHGKYYKE